MQNLCECGCGKLAPLASKTMKSRGWIKGQPIRFIFGHHNCRNKAYSDIPYSINHETGCWVWQRSFDTKGYAQAWINKKLTRMHRYYYQLHKGPIPDGMQLDHLCKNHACVNPNHLEPVTNRVNVRRGNRTKLTWEQAQQIRSLYQTGKESYSGLARKFHVNPGAIYHVVNHTTWVTP